MGSSRAVSIWSLIPYCAGSRCSYNCWASQIPHCERNWAKWANVSMCNLRPRLQVPAQAPPSLEASPSRERPREDTFLHFELLSLFPFLNLSESVMSLLAIWRFLQEACNVCTEFSLLFCISFLCTKLPTYETQYLIFPKLFLPESCTVLAATVWSSVKLPLLSKLCA